MKKIFILILIILAGMLVIAIYYDSGSKSEYLALQVLEQAERKTMITNAEIRTKHGYIIAGFRATSGKENTWVLLNAKHSPYYKQMPQVPFTLTRADMDKIRRMPEVSETVLAVLETRIRESE
jgi:hypothetical protein